jgi:glutamate formiminotransferase
LTRKVLKFVHQAPNKALLMVKVALLFRVFGRCRRQELVNKLVDHIKHSGSVVVVNVSETKTDKKRVFTIIDEKEMNCLKLHRYDRRVVT